MSFELFPNFKVPDYVQSVIPYAPGKPIEETQREFGIKKVVKLASNENPLGPSPRALEAVRKALKDTHRYPDGAAFSLKQALANHLKVGPASLIVGNGSNEIIDFLVRTFCVPGDSIVTSQAAFIAYKLCAQIHGVQRLETPLDRELKADLKHMAELARNNERVRIVFVANPNNPTGTYSTTEELTEFLEEMSTIREGSVLVALDYAYWEYVTARDLPDATPFVRKYPNVVVLRTFSKIYGLAGFRLGYGICAPEVAALLERVRQPFNVNSLAMRAAEAALGDKAFVKKSREVNRVGMAFWEKTLRSMGIPYWKSQGNFLLADVQKGMGKSGPEVYHACLRKGAIFRPVANYGMPHALRISVGTAAENDFAAKVLKSVRLQEAGARAGRPNPGIRTESAKTRTKAGRKR